MNPSNNDGEDLSRSIDDANKEIREAQTRVEAAQNTRSTRLANRAGDLYGTAQDKVSTLTSVVSGVQPIIESEAMKGIRDGLTTFFDSIPGVLRALDEVANIHPFIKVAVGAFRVVVELDMKRRDNEKKITVLFIEMRDMMEVLIQLRTIQDEDTPGPDGTTIKARLQGLIKRTADDIKDCANVCDAYAKKKLIVKVLKSSSWDDKFKSYVTLFADRRKAFTFALEMHVGKAVDDANRKLESVDTKLDVILRLFSTLVSPEQERLLDFVGTNGGPEAIMKNSDALVTLIKLQLPVATTSKRHAEGGGHQESDPKEELQSLQEELFDSTETAIQRNMELFERKFIVQQRRLLEQMQATVRHEGDRVIDKVLSGPHERIKDSDIYEIWKEMRWRGHVKARHFVLALRDYYFQSIADSEAAKDGTTTCVSKDDRWALDYINVSDTSSIAEAFDDDASGFITIAEVNHFTSSRPAGWSLLKWLAYWTRGWHVVLCHYRDKITSLLGEMFALLPTIRAENHILAFKYLNEVWEEVCLFTSSLEDVDDPDEKQNLWPRFSSYVESEERRLAESLNTFQYCIDGADTLALITGPGRFEKFLLPLLYLHLRRDLDVFRLCHRNVVIHHYELVDRVDSIRYILDAVDERCNTLEALFRQQHFSPKRQFESFAHGLYYWYSDDHGTIKELMDEGFPEIKRWTQGTQALPAPDDILLYPTVSGELSQSEDANALTDEDRNAGGVIKDIVGLWYAFFADEWHWPGYPMYTFFIHATSGPEAFVSTAVTPAGEKCKMTGCFEDGSSTTFTATLDFGGSRTWHLTGTFDSDRQSITGRWTLGNEHPENPDYFYLTRLSPEILCARPPPWEFNKNKTKALWRFALTYAREQAKRRLSWKYIKAYIDRRKRYVELLLKEEDLDDDSSSIASCEMEEIEAIERTFSSEQAALCHRILDLKQRAAESIDEYECGVCEEELYDVRYTCIQCSVKLDRSVDFCDRPRCLDTRTEIDETVHLPSHDLVKFRRPVVVHYDLPQLFPAAKEALARAQTTLKHSRHKPPVTGTRDDKLTSDADDHGKGEGGDEWSSESGSDSQAEEGDSESDVDGASDGAGSGEESESSSDSETSDSAASSRGVHSSTRSVRGRRGGGNPKKSNAIPTCSMCTATVQRPCFICIECKNADDVFMCSDCDKLLDDGNSDEHPRTHAVVRCTVPAISGTEQRLDVIEKRVLELMEKQAAAHRAQISALCDKVSKLEHLLKASASSGKSNAGRRRTVVSDVAYKLTKAYH
ncbi:hypothetical protein C8Q70DRAFT_329793 [Cubamyces menziesii]|nr:hypothetical protein C8Q70DRAFT_329793 [Cubamyces menziesii]